MTSTGKRARILFVTSSFPRWRNDSTTPFIQNLAVDLRALGWDVHVLAPHAPGALTREVIDGVPVERFTYFWPRSLETVCYRGGALLNLRRNPANFASLPLLVMCEWLAIERCIQGGAFDLVHSHWILPQGFTAALATRRHRLPHVATIHGSDIFALNGRVLTACKRFALRHAEAVTANSSATLEAAQRVSPGLRKLERIPMGTAIAPANLDSVQRLRTAYRRVAGPLLLFVGRLVEQKGAADLLDAVPHILPRLPDVTAIVVGDGPERQPLEKRARRLGIADRVRFTGWVDAATLADYYHAADIFVGPSKQTADGAREAQGLTFIEAMLAGTPVIATRIGGIGDAIRHGETGLLVNAGAPAEIAQSVIEIHQDTELRERMRSSARALAEREFTRNAAAQAFSALYERVLTRCLAAERTAADER